MVNYYPLLLDIDYKKVVIVGGGLVAAQKVAGLRATKADIVVVSPMLHESLEELAQQGVFTWKEKYFEPKDVDDAVLVFAATDNEQVNALVQESCQHWQLVNRTDNQQESDFITPATVRRGQLVVTVSTSGANPGLARKMKKDLDEQFDEVYADYIDFLQQARLLILASVEKNALRRALLKQLLAPEILEWTRTGNLQAREQFLQDLLTREVTE